MVTPTVIKVDPNASLTLSPIRVDAAQSGERQSSRRSRKHAVEMKNYKEMRSKYQDAKTQMERMKREGENNRRMLLEMSSALNALKDIAVDYDRDEKAASSPIVNVQRKIRAIDEQLKSSMMHCGHLEKEKQLQSSTIKAQEGQIKTMEDQIMSLQKRLKKAIADKRKSIAAEKEALEEMTQKGELESTIKAQEAKIKFLEDQVHRFSAERSSTLSRQIEALKGSNEAKYQEISEMEKKLQYLRSVQSGQHNQLVPYEGDASKHVSFLTDAIAQLSCGSSDQSSQSSLGSRSSTNEGRTSLASISEEHPTGREDHDIFVDGDEVPYSSRSHPDDVSIQITPSKDDESVEVVVGKLANFDVSDVSCTTNESTISAGPTFEEEYNKAMERVDQIQADNEKLRQDHSDVLANMAHVAQLNAGNEKLRQENEDVKKALEEQKHLTTLANTKHEKLRREHARVTEELNAMNTKHAQLEEDYGKVAHRESDLQSFDSLRKIHSAVVMKMADMGEENEALIEERTQLRNDLDKAESSCRSLGSELDATKNAYEDLQAAHDASTNKIEKLSDQLNVLKTKYYETLAEDETIHSSPNIADERYESLRREYESALEQLHTAQTNLSAVEKLERENSEILAKVAVLEQTNRELEEVKTKYHASEAKINMLERDVVKAEKKEEASKKREAKRSSHLKDMLSHYKRLEKEHDEMNQKLKRLQAVVSNDEFETERSKNPLHSVPAGPGALADHTNVASLHAKIGAYESRVKELQQQRDNAMEQMNQLEEELSRTRLEKIEACRSRKAREKDLKVVLGHYHNLQKENDGATGKIERLEALIVEAGQAAVLEVATVLNEDVTANNQPKQGVSFTEPTPANEISFAMNAKENNGEVNENGDDEEPPALSSPSKNNKDGQESSVKVIVDDDSIAQLLVDMETLKRKKDAWNQRTDVSTVSNVSNGPGLDELSEKSVLSDEAPSTGWKDAKIAGLLQDLAKSKSQVRALEKREKVAKAELEKTEQRLLMAQREAEDARKRQTAREGNLRDVIAQQKRLEKDHEQVRENVVALEEQLEKAKTETKLREEELKAVRQRAASQHTQFKKLEEKHANAMKVIESNGLQVEV